MNELTMLQVGKVYTPFIGMPEGCRATMTSSGLELSIGFELPTLDEEAQIRKEQGTFKILHINDIAIFLCKFGALNWMDCPLVFEDDLEEELPDGVGYAMNVIFYDTTTGRIAGLRTIGLGNNFSKSVQALRKELPIFTVTSMLQRYQRAQIEYSSEDMAKITDIEYITGTLN